MADTHKVEAVRALQQVIARLNGAEPLEGLPRFQLKATLEYALAEIKEIQELKRRRSTSKEEEDDGSQ